MLTYVIAVVGGVENVSVVNQPGELEALNDTFNDFVDSLERPKAIAIEMIVEIYVCLILLREA